MRFAIPAPEERDCAVETGLAVRGIARRNVSRAQRDFLDLVDLITLRWLALWNFASDALGLLLRFCLTQIFATSTIFSLTIKL